MRKKWEYAKENGLAVFQCLRERELAVLGESAFYEWKGAGSLILERDGRNLHFLKDESVDCIFTDHPWLDLVSNRGGNRKFADFSCFQYTAEDFREKARVLKTGRFLAELLPAENENNFKYLYQIKEMAAGCGLEYYCKVSWKKGRFVSNTGRKAKNSQDIMIFSKGKARALRLDAKRTKRSGELTYMSGANGMLPCEFNVEPVPKADRIHPGELPVSLCGSVIHYLTKPGEIVLDPFAGSGSIGMAALKAGRSSILIESGHLEAERMRERFKQREKELAGTVISA